LTALKKQVWNFILDGNDTRNVGVQCNLLQAKNKGRKSVVKKQVVPDSDPDDDEEDEAAGVSPWEQDAESNEEDKAKATDFAMRVTRS